MEVESEDRLETNQEIDGQLHLTLAESIGHNKKSPKQSLLGHDLLLRMENQE